MCLTTHKLIYTDYAWTGSMDNNKHVALNQTVYRPLASIIVGYTSLQLVTFLRFHLQV